MLVLIHSGVLKVPITALQIVILQSYIFWQTSIYSSPKCSRLCDAAPAVEASASLHVSSSLCERKKTKTESVWSAAPPPTHTQLLEQGAAPQRLGGRAKLEHVAVETGELLSHVPAAFPSRASVLHGQQLGAQVVEPQHVGVRLVGAPVVPEATAKN